MIKTKLIATLGPASANQDCLRDMFDVGLDVCRLNFSHGDHDTHRQTLELVRSLASERQQPICVIGDLCGPKIRLGTFAAGAVELERGKTVRFVRGTAPCTAELLTVSFPTFIDEVREGQRIYIDDGMVRLLVVERTADALVCTCTYGGQVNSHKGVNLPDTRLTTPALTAKDRDDLEWAIEHGLDYVALSFVRQPADLYELKQLVEPHTSGPRVIIKIEKTEALEHLDELIAHTDAVLVARGDLGVETDIWRVPLIQKDIVARCQRAGVPVIVATQMLQSMVHSPMPTRAEVSDVANAILERVDAVMLSAETAVGQHPGMAVDMMNRIAQATEAFLADQPPYVLPLDTSAQQSSSAAIAHAAVQAARDINARLVAVWTATGQTVKQVARHRLSMPVVGLTYSQRVYQQLNLLFGVEPVRVQPLDNPAAMAASLDSHLLERELAVPGDLVVVVTSTRPHTPGGTDTVIVHRVESGVLERG
ncbi:MAG: pyruvate kinase [Planctomycetota bacterium]